MQRFEIHQPVTPDAICSCLKEYGDSAVIHAGGTDLLVRLRNRLINPSHVIDLSKVDSLKSLERLPEGGIRIGGMVTIAEISSLPDIETEYQALYEALESIGSLQIRNRGTLVGNICNASPAADSVPPLLVFDSTVNIRGRNGTRNVPLDDFISGPGETSLEPDEFVESVELPHPDGVGSSAYMKIGRRKAVDCSIVGVAVRLGSEKDVRIAFGAVASKPIRIHSVEKMLAGQEWNTDLINLAATQVQAEVRPIDDIRASKEYRIGMSAVLFKRVFGLANERLAGAL
jgi:xanthine dehydrogenase FAD-binding subunit